MSNGRVTYKDIMDFQEKVFHELTEVRGDIAGIGASLAAGEANFKAINKRLDTNEASIIKVRNLNTFIALLGSTVAGIIGINK
jgi:hypothetical protein